MKKLIYSLIIVVLYFSSYAQFSNPDEFKSYAPGKSKPVLKSTSALLNKYDQKFVWIDVAVSVDTTDIAGSVKYLLRAKTDIDTVYFEFTPYLTVDSVTINNQPVLFYHGNDSVLVFAQAQIPNNTEFEIKLYYHGATPNSPGSYRGLIKTWSNVYNYYITWTLSESFHLKDWLPCKQDLTDRFDSAWVFITVDTSLKAGSEGRLTNITNFGNGKHRFEWKTHHPMAYYLLSLAVGDYYEYNIYTQPASYSDSILIQNLIYNTSQCINDNMGLINLTGPLINLYSEKFGLYPWADEKYGHSMCPVGGGMEHQTMTSLGLFNTDLVAHELSHQWFGDNITCSNWQDIWVNEGIASYAEYIYWQNMVSQAIADSNIVYCQKRAKLEPNGSIYVPFSEIWNEGRIFHYNLSYKKGSAFMHMIRYLCNNDSLFFSALKQLNIIYKDSVITGSDVQHVFENVTGKSFTDLFNQYYYGEGYPVYKFTWQQDSSVTGFGDLNIKLEQQGSSLNNPLFTTPLPIKIIYSDSTDTLITVYPVQNIQYFNVSVKDSKITSIVFDPKHWILANVLSIAQDVKIINEDRPYIQLYPSPAAEYILFRYSGQGNFDGKLNLYDLSGRVVLSCDLDSGSELIPFTGISPGIYMAEITENKVILFRQKVVKQ